jgi:hypothetical protein
MIKRKPDPKPYAAKEVQLIGAMTAIWVTVGVVVALAGTTSDHLWTIAVGVLLGLNGVRIAIKRKKKLDAGQLSS